MKPRHRKFLLGGLVVAAALGYLIFGGLQETLVYFVTPTELREQGEHAVGRALRVGGMVETGSVLWDPRTLDLAFRLSDGVASVPVRHRGVPPDLFAEGRGAVVEGTVTADGVFQASQILAKHSEEYRPPREGEDRDALRERFKSLLKEKPAS
ncbi:MAG: cytochrome c maturation protein CcmE [candidate division NC10 bacterium]|nr:cytochrome c maturation protein CcmE [candidate division NC10 bacterium]MBI4392044.1 cytochrome c maturation protein CcmE [candidate division NC10 bacterium]